MKEYEIWIGNYHLGQGYDSPTEPEFLCKILAINFEVACLKYELKNKLRAIEYQEVQGYVDNQTKEWFYNPIKNYNSWTGKYYPSQEEALKSF